MHNPSKSISFILLIVIATLSVSACSGVPLGGYPTPVAPGYGPGRMMNGGMMGGNGHMNGNMMGGGMMGGYGPVAPTVAPTPFDATPVPVDEEIQISAEDSRFVPAQITVKLGKTVRFIVTNDDPYLHNFVSPEAGIPFLNLPGKTTQTVVWTAPAAEQTYTALCTLHPGMNLFIAVED